MLFTVSIAPNFWLIASAFGKMPLFFVAKNEYYQKLSIYYSNFFPNVFPLSACVSISISSALLSYLIFFSLFYAFLSINSFNY